ncbi:D-alanine--D-alanine ligase [Lihuaxuella thermophila]|uniref:D-alanine--D-alanine ligase n=1 Tax=Lihuaxuella thermophila TaxID=1173111 RepID=A0A1H8D110_9BACL|nr:D-alanine--D-alanine ligase [Lihuaxuella thermophila]SEN00906.1 D-alanine-D-alanine ligase [Lihuaxuella thermophila]
MRKKLRVAVLFGGKSGEHEVSLLSAASVIGSLDPEKYEVIPMGITREGIWKLGQESLPMIQANLDAGRLEQLQSQLPVAAGNSRSEGNLPSLEPGQVDVVFPVLHGTYGEDGTIQGLLEIADLPYVGAGVLASAVGMDKVMCKKILEQAGLPQGGYTYFLRKQVERNQEQVLDEIEQRFGYPCFVKPANLGSSVGISKASNREELINALQLAGKYDRKIVIEEFIPAHEVEVAVLGNDEPQASVPGEIVSSNEFYDYKAKYIDGKSVMRIPADLPPETAEQVRSMAIKAYKAIDCSGLARVDFFIRKDNGQVLINEINTMPGFTPFSMYAKLWEHSGLSYSELVSKLIDLALERYEEKSQLITTFEVE